MFKNSFQVAFAMCVLVECLVIIKSASYTDDDTVVSTCHGRVRGGVKYSRCNTTFYSFRGIPFAAPPVGNLRFKAPVPPEPWEGVLDTLQDGSMCIQKNYLFNEHPEVEGKEDCLYLNVYTPKIPSMKSQSESQKRKSSLPVMVFIHYGAFFAGSGSSEYFGPEYFMDKDVVLVTFNYRLGVFGFLTTNDDASPGNWGLKDQVAALKWVQDNIGAFGGNNKKVTIFGQSAGAGSVHFHLLSPTTTNLFHGAIAQSGSTLSLWARPFNQIQALVAQQQAHFVGCGNHINNTFTMVECLRKVDAETLAESADRFKTFSTEPFSIFAPVTEKKTLSNPNPYITEDPLDLIKAGRFHKVPWIIGVVADEGILRAAPLLRQSTIQTQLNANFSVIGPRLLGLGLSVTESHIPTVWKKITNHFVKGEFVNVSRVDSIQGFIDLYSDRAFNYGSYQSALLHAQKGHSPVWFYNFAYKGSYTYGDHFASTPETINFKWGVSHCDDLLYLFPSPRMFSPLKTKDDILMSKVMVQLWTNFATYGHPTPNNEIHGPRWNSLPNLENVTTLKNSDLIYLNITGPYKPEEGTPIRFEIANEFYTKRMKFWGELPLGENIDSIK